MNKPPKQKDFDKAFTASHDLTPTPSAWGLFSYSDAPAPVCGSGMGTFQWFRTKKQLKEFKEYLKQHGF